MIQNLSGRNVCFNSAAPKITTFVKGVWCCGGERGFTSVHQHPRLSHNNSMWENEQRRERIWCEALCDLNNGCWWLHTHTGSDWTRVFIWPAGTWDFVFKPAGGGTKEKSVFKGVKCWFDGAATQRGFEWRWQFDRRRVLCFCVASTWLHTRWHQSCDSSHKVLSISWQRHNQRTSALIKDL